MIPDMSLESPPNNFVLIILWEIWDYLLVPGNIEMRERGEDKSEKKIQAVSKRSKTFSSHYSLEL